MGGCSYVLQVGSSSCLSLYLLGLILRYIRWDKPSNKTDSDALYVPFLYQVLISMLFLKFHEHLSMEYNDFC